MNNDILFDDFDFDIDYVNYSAMTMSELVESLEEIDAKLRELGELLVPKTAEGRNLHGDRVAVVVHLKDRGMQ